MIAVVALLAGVLVVTRGSGEAAEGEIFLEPAGAPGPDAFTDSADTNTAPPPVQLEPASPTPAASAPATATPAGSPSAAPRTTMRSVQGSSPGLYGGTHGRGPCDPAKLVSFLQADPAKAAAWAGVQGIVPKAIRGFIDRLTPVVLRADTRVTDHAYRDGRPVPQQAILQAGTAVLVGGLGRPRVRCASGNPLSPPRPQRSGVRYSGDPWPRFRPARVIVVVNTVKVRVTKFILVDLVRPGYFVRPAGTSSPAAPPADGDLMIDTFCDLFPEGCRPPGIGPGGNAPPARPGEPTLGTGDVQITLRWNTTADLDLAVVDPTGELINYDARTSSSGGQLDVDSNGDCENLSSTPVENVFWPQGASPEGEYRIYVTYFGQCPGASGPQSFELTVLMGGVPVDVQDMKARGGTTFTVLSGDPAANTGVFATMGDTGVLDSPSDYVVGTASKQGGGAPASERPPHAPQRLSATGVDPGSLSVNWLPSFDEDSGVETSFEITIEPGGTTFVVPYDLPGLTVPGLEPNVEYTISIVAVNAAGRSPAATITGTPWGTDEPPAEEPPASAPGAETLEQYCDRVYGPPPTFPAENPRWTLCMHDPTTTDIPEAGSLPISAEGT